MFVAIRACVRCHSKKIKCDGIPDCRACNKVGARCVPHVRAKRDEHARFEALERSQQRVQWLENELMRLCSIDCAGIQTGTQIQCSRGVSYLQRDYNTIDFQSTQNPLDVENLPKHEEAPELSLLALNATGETRFLGPSSGTFFAAYTTSLTRSCDLFGEQLRKASNARHNLRKNRGVRAVLNEVLSPLSTKVIQLLLRSYQTWLQPLYPLLRTDYLKDLVAKGGAFQLSHDAPVVETQDHQSKMAIFYLVMALGAANLKNTIKALEEDHQAESFDHSSLTYPSATVLYSMAMKSFDGKVQDLRPSLSSIQTILLISIYSSYGPIRPTQWQLAGLAMRMSIEIGLHSSSRGSKMTDLEIDDRRRAFWTAYAIEISLAYNLGRPPSIAEQHISAKYPDTTDETSLTIHYIKHRQIQNQIMSQIYFPDGSARLMPTEERLLRLATLQSELDSWHSHLSSLSEMIGKSAYPHSYWERLYNGTSFVLHRSSPLCPQPTPLSSQRCIHYAGSYLNNMVMILRNSHVPLSWMLVQGVLFAGLTMLVTIKTGAQALISQAEIEFLTVDCPAWTRKCSVCLAIMNERWRDDLLSELDDQFEALATEVFTNISKGFVSQGLLHETPYGNFTHIDDGLPSVRPSSVPRIPQGSAAWGEDAFFDTTFADNWQSMEPFKDILGFDGTQSFWDAFPTDTRGDEIIDWT